MDGGRPHEHAIPRRTFEIKGIRQGAVRGGRIRCRACGEDWGLYGCETIDCPAAVPVKRREDVELVVFQLQPLGLQVTPGGRRRRHSVSGLLETAFWAPAHIAVSLDLKGGAIVCTHRQFSRFLIERDRLGHANGFKELEARFVRLGDLGVLSDACSRKSTPVRHVFLLDDDFNAGAK